MYKDVGGPKSDEDFSTRDPKPHGAGTREVEPFDAVVEIASYYTLKTFRGLEW